MTTLGDEARVHDLLAPLGRVEPVSLPHESSRRASIVVAVLAVAILAVGAAIAAGFDPFDGIGAADRAQRPRDVLPAAALNRLDAVHRQFDAVQRRAGTRPVLGTLLPETSRLLGRLASGRKIYVVRTTTNALFIIVTDRQGRLQASSSGEPLTQKRPITVASLVRVKNGPHATPPLFYGIARDDITAISFRARGRTQTVPVKNNVWFYEGNSNLFASRTIHYANGNTRTVTH
jgi:hypothetical protein